MPAGFDIHPELLGFTSPLADMPPDNPPAEQRRAWRAHCLANEHPRPPGLRVREIDLWADDHAVPARIYQPAGTTGRLPGILYYHGGGWMLGDLDTHDAIAWGLAEGAQAVVVSVDYRLAPEHRYPAALDDCYAALVQVAGRADEFGMAAARIALCGDSAGGNLAAAVSLAARDRQGPSIAAQALVYPVLDVAMETSSYIENADAPALTRADMERYLDAYLGARHTVPDAYAMPLHAADLGGLPPALVHTAEYDPLRDEGYRYYERLITAGNEAEYRCARRMVHGFVRARFAGPATAAEFEAVCTFLRRRLA